MDLGLVNHLGGGSSLDRVDRAAALVPAFHTEPSDEEIRTVRAEREVSASLLGRGEGGR